MTPRCVCCGDPQTDPGLELCQLCEDQADDEYATAARHNPGELEAMDDWIEVLEQARLSNEPHPDRPAAARSGGARWAAAATPTPAPHRGPGADRHGTAAAAHP